MPTGAGYVHGYQPREHERLEDQAGALVDLLHVDPAYPPGSVILGVGCGIGSQTLTLAQHRPRTTQADGVFCYIVFKAVATVVE